MSLKITKWLFLLLVVSLPLVRPFNFAVSGLRVAFTDLIFIGVFGFWLIALVRRETQVKYDKFYLFLGLYGLALTISAVFSVTPQRSFFKLLGEFYLFGLAIVTFHLAQEKGFIKRIVRAWLAGTLLTVLASFAGFVFFYLGYKTPADNYFLSHFGSLPAGNYPRIHALFANANMMANFLNVSLMLAVLAETAGWLKKFYARVLQAGIWLAAIFTFSAGLGGMILSFGIWFWAIFRARKSYKSAAISLFGGGLLAAAVFGSTLVSPDTNNTTQQLALPLTDKIIEPSVRVLVWENSFDNFLQNPFFGKGTGTDAAMLRYTTLSGDNQVLLDAHNIWLNLAVQTGLFGLAAFAVLTVFLIEKLKLRFPESNESNLAQLSFSCAFIGVFLYQGLSGSFEDARHLWILFGLLVANFTFSKNGISAASEEL